jgi:hypothetical protein
MNCIPYRGSEPLSASVHFETAYILVRNDISEMAYRDIEEVSRHLWRIERHGRVVWSEDGRMLAVTRLLMDEETWEHDIDPNAT